MEPLLVAAALTTGVAAFFTASDIDKNNNNVSIANEPGFQKMLQKINQKNDIVLGQRVDQTTPDAQPTREFKRPPHITAPMPHDDSFGGLQPANPPFYDGIDRRRMRQAATKDTQEDLMNSPLGVDGAKRDNTPKNDTCVNCQQDSVVTLASGSQACADCGTIQPVTLATFDDDAGTHQGDGGLGSSNMGSDFMGGAAVNFSDVVRKDDSGFDPEIILDASKIGEEDRIVGLDTRNSIGLSNQGLYDLRGRYDVNGNLRPGTGIFA